MAEVANTSVVISAVDKATDVINGITGSFGTLESKWSKLTAALGITAGAAYLTNLVKQSLEAADSMGDLAAQVGVSVETLSRYQLAAQASGTSLEGLAGGIKKLSVNMIEAASGNEEMAQSFDAVGVSVKDANGQLRSADDVLLDVAEAFANTEDGTSKTAAAIKIFGKAGAELIPFLNNGKEGLAEFAATAEALGLALDSKTVAAADRANDTIGILTQVTAGFGNKVLREVLPTLEGLAAQLLDAAKKSGALDTAAQGVAAVFKLVVSVGVAAYNTLMAVGGAIGGIVAAVVQAVQGDFKGAWNTVKSVAEDTGKRVVVTAQQIGAVWTESLGTVDEKTRALSKGFEGLAKDTAAAKKGADEYAKAAKLVAELTGKSVGVSGDYVEKLKALEIWYGRNQDKTEQYVTAVRQLIAEQQSSKDLLKAEEEQRKALAKAIEESEAAQRKSIVAYAEETGKISAKAAELRNEAALLGLTKEKQAELTAERREAEIATLEALRVSYDMLGAGELELKQIDDRIAALRALGDAELNLAQKGALVAAAEQTQKAWAKTAEQIEQSLTDALVGWLDSGKSITRSIGDWIVNYFKTWVARSIAQALTGAITSGLAGVANATGLGGLLGGGTSSGGGAGGLLNIGSGLSSLLGGAGSSFLSGIGSTLSGASSMASFMGLLEGGSFAAAAGVAAPYALPVIAAVMGLSKLFGNKSSPAQQNYTAIGSTDFGYSGNVPNLQSSSAYQSVLAPIVSGVADIVAQLGGTLGNTSYGIYTSASPDNKGATLQVNAAGAAGELFKAWSNAANETLQERIAATLPALLLAGIQDADLPAEFERIFGALDVNTASAAQVQAAVDEALRLVQERAAETEPSEVEQAQIETSETVYASAEQLRQQTDLLTQLNAAIATLREVAERGLAATASAAADAGNQVTRAVLTLAPAEVNGGAL